MKVTFFFTLIMVSYTMLGNSTITKADKYSTFCRIYGVVKYYSNDVSQGKLNWELRTVEYLGKLDSVDNVDDYNILLSQYLSVIESKGLISSTLIDYAKIKDKYNLKEIEPRVDFKWIDTELLTNENQRKVKSIISSFELQKNKSFELKERGKTINHREFFQFDETALNHKHYLLGFFQYWNIIEYFFPHKSLMDISWDNVLKGKINSFSAIENREDYILEIKKLTSLLNDSHAFVDDLKIKKNVGERRHAFNFIVIEDKIVLYSVFNDSLKSITPLKKGAILTHINDVPIDSLITKYATLESHSRCSISKNRFAAVLNGFTYLGDSICYTFDNNVKVVSKKVIYPLLRQTKNLNSTRHFKDLDTTTGYINASNIGYFEFGKAMRRFKHKKYIIFDCRGYADFSVLRYGVLLGGKPKDVSLIDYPFYRLPGHYLKQKENYFGSMVEMAFKMIGLIPENAGNIIPSFKRSYQGKGIILTSEKAISFGETNIMTLKTYCHDCITIGSNTTGANGNVAKSNIIGNLQIGYTGIDFRFANGTVIQRVGITPDIRITPNLKDFKNNVDTLLLYSLEYIKNHP